jgi:hypothetical protein
MPHTRPSNVLNLGGLPRSLIGMRVHRTAACEDVDRGVLAALAPTGMSVSYPKERLDEHAPVKYPLSGKGRAQAELSTGSLRRSTRELVAAATPRLGRGALEWVPAWSELEQIAIRRPHSVTTAFCWAAWIRPVGAIRVPLARLAQRRERCCPSANVRNTSTVPRSVVPSRTPKSWPESRMPAGAPRTPAGVLLSQRRARRKCHASRYGRRAWAGWSQCCVLSLGQATGSTRFPARCSRQTLTVGPGVRAPRDFLRAIVYRNPSHHARPTSSAPGVADLSRSSDVAASRWRSPPRRGHLQPYPRFRAQFVVVRQRAYSSRASSGPRRVAPARPTGTREHRWIREKRR